MSALPIGIVDSIVERRERYAALARTPSLRARILGVPVPTLAKPVDLAAGGVLLGAPVRRTVEVPKPAPEPILPPPRRCHPPFSHRPVPPELFWRALRAVLEAFGVTGVEFWSMGRTQRIAYSRSALSLYLRDLGYSFTAIGDLMRRDHTTILSGARRARLLYDGFAEFRSKYDAALELLK